MDCQHKLLAEFDFGRWQVCRECKAYRVVKPNKSVGNWITPSPGCISMFEAGLRPFYKYINNPNIAEGEEK